MADLSFTLGGVSIDGTFFPVTSASADPTITPFLAGANGTRYADLAGCAQSLPRQTFTTPAIATASTAVGFAGVSIATAVNLYYLQYDQLGNASGMVHIKSAITKGIVVLDSITASDTGQAMATYTVYALSTDGATVPMIITQNNALPAPGALAEIFFSGPCVINAATYQTTSIGFTSGWSVGHSPVSGLPFPTRAQLETADPVFNIGLADFTAATAITSTGAAGTNIAIYFRAGAEAGDGRVAAASLAHLKISAANAYVQAGAMDGSWRSPASNTITVHPRSATVGAAPVVITASQAMPS